MPFPEPESAADSGNGDAGPSTTSTCPLAASIVTTPVSEMAPAQVAEPAMRSLEIQVMAFAAEVKDDIVAPEHPVPQRPPAPKQVLNHSILPAIHCLNHRPSSR
ncbi:hypothetical protein GCM10022256_07670 [Frondihabitans peucedani]|uniref:Uncharacterized protein n=1 Tax=Frondihabitans peucedani TaxID=598626 RepID=A0ABP8DYU2_9MICO